MVDVSSVIGPMAPILFFFYFFKYSIYYINEN